MRFIPRWLVLLGPLLLTATASFGFPLQLLLTKLPADSEYRSSIAWLIENSNLVEDWNPDWNFPIAKNDVVKKVKDILEKTNEYLKQDPSVDDVWLFRVLLEQYLYNLDESSYHEQIVKDVDSISSMFPDDYRPMWLLALHYTKMARTIESIEKYEQVTKKFPEESLSPFFWVDYADAAYFAGMLIHSRTAFERAAGLAGDSFLSGNTFYNSLDSLIVDPIAGLPVSADETYAGIKQREEYGILSRLFGMWIPTRADWKVHRSGITDGKSLLAMKIGPVKNNTGRNINYSIVVNSSANNKIAFNEYIQRFAQKGDSMERIPDFLQGMEQETYEWKNPDMYKEVGGGYFLIQFFRLLIRNVASQ